MDPFRLLRFKSMRDRSDSDEADGRQSSRWLAARLDDAAVERGGDRMETLHSHTDAGRPVRHYKRIARRQMPKGQLGACPKK